MERHRIDKAALRETITSLEGLTNEQKAGLLQLLSEQKPYGLVWEGHAEDVEEQLRTQLPVLCEDASKRILSTDAEAPNHVLIEGDNLHALTALTYTHEGKVDVIYIDPPYNTGNKDFVYNDSFVDSEDGYRHSKWLSFMHKRLNIAKRLLSDRGVIFISIDDNEQANLKLLCDEVFGPNCFMGNVSWQRTYSTRNDKKGFVRELEYICVYSKSPEWMPNKLARTAEMDAKYKNPDNDVAPWTSDNPCAPGASTHQGMVYAIQNPFTGEMMYPARTACWRYQQDEMLRIMNGWADYELKDLNDEEQRAKVCGIPTSEVRAGVKAIVLSNSIEESMIRARAVYERGQWPKFYFTKKGLGGMRRKTYLNKVEGVPPTNYFPYSETGHTDEAKKEILAIFEGSAPFDTPKPTRLIKRLEQISTDKDSLILDFFAGSGTTLHATMQLNAEDGGHRQCILVTNNENGICENVTYERNRRVIQGYTTPKGVEVPGLSGNNLRYYRTDFVERENTHQNRKRLMEASVDLVCLREGIYHEEERLAGRRINTRIMRYFTEGERQLLFVFEPAVIPQLAQLLPQVATPQCPLRLYVFSDGAYAYEDELRAVADRIEVCALPNAIRQAYKSALPRPIEKELESVNLEETVEP